MKFVKRPIVVEAIQWYPDVKVEGVFGNTPKIETADWIKYLNPGCWIVTGIEGERYLVKDSVFQETYDPVDEG